jgi:V/A-type H+-transporting ATPase subunit E
VEVLRTGEELERQILEDARRKASRTLEAAEKESQAIRGELEAQLARDVGRVEADRDRRIAALHAELEAQLPLDFMRARLAWVDGAVKRALRELFASMPGSEITAMLASRMRAAAGQFGDREVTVAWSGLTAEAARTLVEGALPRVRIVSVRAREAQHGEELTTGVLVESTDGRLRFRCTLAEIESQLLEELREEVAEALLGREALLDGGAPTGPAGGLVPGEPGPAGGSGRTEPKRNG